MPSDRDGPRFLLWEPEFARDPHSYYAEMRKGDRKMVPVELAPGVSATLVIDYCTAVQILNDPEHFPADPRAWQSTVPSDCLILPLIGYRPVPARTTGAEHRRYVDIHTDAMRSVDLYAMHDHVEKLAIELINGFCADGHADLIQQYSFPLSFAVCNVLLGCPPHLGDQIAEGMAKIFENTDAEAGNARCRSSAAAAHRTCIRNPISPRSFHSYIATLHTVRSDLGVSSGRGLPCHAAGTEFHSARARAGTGHR